MRNQKIINSNSSQARTGYDNLRNQILSVKNGTNVKSYATRARYFDGTERFVRYCAEEWNLQKFVNVSGKHIRGYVAYMQESGIAPSTVLTDLASIRYFHKYAGGRNKLPGNRELGLEKREHGKFNRAWLPDEIEKAVAVAKTMGRMDAAIGIRLGQNFGLRIIEMCKLDVEHLHKAITFGELRISGKGGQVRAIPLETKGQRELVYRLLDYARSKGLAPGDYLISNKGKRGVEKEKKSLQSWMHNHRGKFIDPDRLSKVASGEKARVKLPSWHGLRHYYAQSMHKSLRDIDGKYALKEVSERLGHHRPGITKDYLAEAKS